MISYGVSKDSFPQIKFSSEKKVKEQERSVVDKEIIKDAWETLSKKWEKYWIINNLSHVCIRISSKRF